MRRTGEARGLRASVLVLGVALLASCGGGDSSGGSAPAASNRAPIFSSAATASLAENATGTILTVAASDPDGDAVTIAISGGVDAAAFTLNGGALAFGSVRDFERPTDADGDNSYEVTLTATDAKGAATSQAVRVTVINDHEGIVVGRVASGFGTDAVIAARQAASGLVVASQDGTVRRIDAATGATTILGQAFSSGESGRVLAVAEFNDITLAMLDITGAGVVVRAVPVSGSSSGTVIQAPLAAASTLAPRGSLFVGGDGFLYGALGDPSGDPAQEPASGYGKLFALQVDPYCGASIFSLCVSADVIGDGIHAPAGGGPYDGQSFLLDRGTDQQEEVDFFNQDARPLDFGWPYREGTYERVASPPAAVNGPSLTYPHGTGVFAGSGLTGGTLYTGAIATLSGKLILTDEAGRIFSLPASFLSDGILHRASELENRTADFAPADGAIDRPVAVVRDRSGRVFVLDGDGELYATK